MLLLSVTEEGFQMSSQIKQNTPKTIGEQPYIEMYLQQFSRSADTHVISGKLFEMYRCSPTQWTRS